MKSFDMQWQWHISDSLEYYAQVNPNETSALPHLMDTIKIRISLRLIHLI